MGGPAFQLDFVDVTRQIMSNAFIDVSLDLIDADTDAMSDSRADNDSRESGNEVSTKGQTLLSFISDVDLVLSTNTHFTLANWLNAAKYWVSLTDADDHINCGVRSQVPVWTSLNYYAAKEWTGLTKSYYRKRWSIFVNGLFNEIQTGILNEVDMNNKITAFENSWQYKGYDSGSVETAAGSLRDIINEVQKRWPAVFI